MSGRDFVVKGLGAMAFLIFIAWIGRYIYMVEGTVDWFRLALVYGIPVGIPHMFVIIPGRLDIGGTLGMVAFCVLIGGLFGAVIAGILFVRACFFIVGYPVGLILRKIIR